MQQAVLNRAMIKMADTTEGTGGVTAQSIKFGLYAKKQRSLWSTSGLTIFVWVISVGVFAAPLAPVSARAQGIPGEIATLQAQVAALESAVATLQAGNSALQSQVNTQEGQITTLQSQVSTSDTTLQSQLTALQNQLNAAKPVLALAPFVSVDPNPENGVIGPIIVFSGANIHVVSGSGSTDGDGQFGSNTNEGVRQPCLWDKTRLRLRSYSVRYSWLVWYAL